MTANEIRNIGPIGKMMTGGHELMTTHKADEEAQQQCRARDCATKASFSAASCKHTARLALGPSLVIPSCSTLSATAMFINGEKHEELALHAALRIYSAKRASMTLQFLPILCFLCLLSVWVQALWLHLRSCNVTFILFLFSFLPASELARSCYSCFFRLGSHQYWGERGVLGKQSV